MRPISVTEKLANSHLPGLIVRDAHTQLGSLEAKVVRFWNDRSQVADKAKCV